MTKRQRQLIAALYAGASAVYAGSGLGGFALSCAAAALYYAIKSQ
jgi:hypothetical protein